MPKHNPVVIYVTANTKNVHEHQCMMHAGSLAPEFDRIYTQKGHGKFLRENNTKLTEKDENADLNIHERIVFCHILDMRDSENKKNGILRHAYSNDGSSIGNSGNDTAKENSNNNNIPNFSTKVHHKVEK